MSDFEKGAEAFRGYSPPLAGVVAFLRSCIRSGEQLSAEDDALINWMLAEARAAATASAQQSESREASAMRELVAALADGLDHVRTCRECGETSTESCAQDGPDSPAAKALDALARARALLTKGGTP